MVRNVVLYEFPCVAVVDIAAAAAAAGRAETAGRHMFSVLSAALKSIDALKATRR